MGNMGFGVMLHYLMADDVTLLPCVVCGSPGEHQSHTYIVGPETTDYWVRCSRRGCPVETGTHESPADAAEAWNTMGAHSTIAALEAQLAEARDCIDLFNRMIVRAECAWKEQHPDSEFYPDVPDLIVWLKEQVDTLAARRCETCAHYDERGWCEVNARTYPSDGFCSEWEAANADS